MNIEHRTSNIERPTSNNEFCQFKKRLGKANLPSTLNSRYSMKGTRLKAHGSGFKKDIIIGLRPCAVSPSPRPYSLSIP